MDVTDRASVEAAARDARAFGKISILVNNAGINKPTDFDKVEDTDWDTILDTNLKGPFICAQVFLPLLAEAGGGSIVHIGSVSGQYGGPRTAHYAASKAGLISLAQVIARFGAAAHVRSNVVAAGLIASDMGNAGLQAASVQKAAEGIILKRLGRTEEVADAVVFLSSDASSYNHGTDHQRQRRTLLLMGKTLLIVSGGIEAADAAKHAKEMGHYVVVSDRDPAGTGLRLCRFLPHRGRLRPERNRRGRRTL